jgi:hypothetical protein
MCRVAPKSSEQAALVDGKGHDSRRDHPNNNTSKVQDTRFNKGTCVLPHALPSAIVPLQLVSEQVGQSFILHMLKSFLLLCYCLMHNNGMCGWVK